MARTPRSTSLETRTARLRLAVRKKPYWTSAGLRGAHLGYRRTSDGNGSWVLRRYLGKQQYLTHVIAQADDYADSDNSGVLSYHEAIDGIRNETQAKPAARTCYSVKDAVEDYVVWLRMHRKSAQDAEWKLRAYVLPFFGEDRLVSSLTPFDFEQWLAWAFKHRPPGRRKKPISDKAPAEGDEAQSPSSDAPVKTTSHSPEEIERRRKSTLNRVMNLMKACFNRAFLTGLVSTDIAWKRLRRFKGADAARIQWLGLRDAQRLIKECAADFRSIVHAAMLTGARWSELRALKVHDYDARSATVLIAASKSGTARRIPLTTEGKAAFKAWTTGHEATDFIFVRCTGQAWGLQDQKRPMTLACEAANIKPAVGFHALRHSYASMLVQKGVSLAVVAEALGHRDTRMVSLHYGHLAPSHVADAIRSNLPKLRVRVDQKANV
jgi:integrase